MRTADIPEVNARLRRDYLRHDAPVVELMQARTRDPFRILVATMLSARTRDETTLAVCGRLFRRVRRPGDLERLRPRELERLIFPVGFYRTKARHLLAWPALFRRDFGGRVPQTLPELCRLPGVGRKTANLVLTDAFDKHGICVDVHVHRICNRLGLVRTRTPAQTEMALRRILPKRYWKTWNRQLVSYGQRTCRPQRPLCDACVIRRCCARVGLPRA